MNVIRPEPNDLVVVGGGPAGLATAIWAALEGLQAVVVERRRPPVDRACGEGIMPDGVAVLEAMGVEIPVDGSAPFSGIRYIDGDLRAEARFPEGHGLGVRRTVLHDALRARAEGLGVELRWGEAVTGLGPNGVETDDGPVDGHWVVAADGRSSNVRSMAGLDGWPVRRLRFGVRRHYSRPPWTDLVEVHWADGCELYVTPVAADLVGVAALTGSRGGGFDDVLAGFPTVRARFEGVSVASRDKGAGPFGQKCGNPTDGRLVLVGDAAGSLDPITGEGLSVAFQEARSAVGCMVTGGLEDYPAIQRRLRRIPTVLTGLLTTAAGRPAIRRRVTAALARSPSLFERFLAISSRSVSPGLVGRNGVLTLALELARYGV